MIFKFLAVMIGAAVGAAARYAVVLMVRPHAPHFPWGTLTVNLIGCAVIGLIAGRIHPVLSTRPDETLWLLLAVGLLGGFTTFSSFGIETLQLISEGRTGSAVGYVLASNVLGLALAAGGYLLTRV
jgi:CrcB protein